MTDDAETTRGKPSRKPSLRLLDFTKPVLSKAAREEIVYQHTVLCQTVLPYRNPGDDVREWERWNGDTGIKVIAGEAADTATRRFVPVGLPYGPKPRLILAHLNAEALRTRSPVIEVDASLSAFARRLGLHREGRTINTIKDQLTRLSAASIRLGVACEGRSITVNSHIVGAFELWPPGSERQRALWPSTVTLSETYFASLRAHAVPLSEAALRKLAHSTMGLDIYAWLAQRLHRVPARGQFVTWKALKDQFGGQYDRMNHFRAVFLKTLEQVGEQYRDARLDHDRRGMTLRTSPPPVSERISLATDCGKPRG